MKKALKITAIVVAAILLACAVIYGSAVAILVGAAKRGFAVQKWLYEEGPYGASQVWESETVYLVSEKKNDNAEYKVSGYVLFDGSWHKFDFLNSRRGLIYFENEGEGVGLRCEVKIKNGKMILDDFYDYGKKGKPDIGKVVLTKCEDENFRLPFDE